MILFVDEAPSGLASNTRQPDVMQTSQPHRLAVLLHTMHHPPTAPCQPRSSSPGEKPWVMQPRSVLTDEPLVQALVPAPFLFFRHDLASPPTLKYLRSLHPTSPIITLYSSHIFYDAGLGAQPQELLQFTETSRCSFRESSFWFQNRR